MKQKLVVVAALAGATFIEAPRADACSSCSSVGDAQPVMLVANPARPSPWTTGWEVRAASSDAASHHGGRERVIDLRATTGVRAWPVRWLAIEASHSAIARWFTVGSSMASAFVSGDLDAFARLQWQSAARAQLFAAAVGARFGTAPALLDEFAIARPTNLQVGSGGTDFLAYLEYMGIRGPWTIGASTRARYASAGRFQWQPGASLSASVAARHQFAAWLSAGVSVDARGALVDRLDGQQVEGTGGVVLAATPSIAFRPSDSWWISASAQIAIAQWWRGAAQDGLSLAVSVQWTPMIPTRSSVVRPRFLQAKRGLAHAPRG